MKIEKFKKEIIKDLEDIIKEWEDGEAYECFTDVSDYGDYMAERIGKVIEKIKQNKDLAKS